MKRFSNVLLVVDTGTDHSAALKRAAALAKNNQASLTLVDIVDSLPAETQMAVSTITPEEFCEIAVAEKRDKLDQIITTITDERITVQAKVLVGKPFIEIIRQVLANEHDLVVKSSEGPHKFRDMLFGSTDMHLLRKCPCPVWIVKPTEHQQYRRILAAVDQDPADAVKDVLNRQILEMSTALALSEFSELHIVHAWRFIGEDYFRSPRTGISNSEVDAIIATESEERQRWLENLVNTYGATRDRDAVDYLKPQLHLIKGNPEHAVPTTAKKLDVDLVVMGTVARSGIAGFFMGNTAESILTQLDCSVLTVKPPGFIGPVTLEA